MKKKYMHLAFSIFWAIAFFLGLSVKFGVIKI